MSTVALVAYAFTQWPATWILVGAATVAGILHHLDTKGIDA